MRSTSEFWPPFGHKPLFSFLSIFFSLDFCPSCLLLPCDYKLFSPIIVLITRYYLISSFKPPLYSSFHHSYVAHSLILCATLPPNALPHPSSLVPHLSHCASFLILFIFSPPFPSLFLSLNPPHQHTGHPSLQDTYSSFCSLYLIPPTLTWVFLPLHLFQSCPTYFPQLLLPWSSRRLTHSPPILRLLSVSPLQQIHTYTSLPVLPTTPPRNYIIFLGFFMHTTYYYLLVSSVLGFLGFS